MVSRITSAASFRSRSPAAWPRWSFTFLRPSTSTKSRATAAASASRYQELMLSPARRSHGGWRAGSARRRSPADGGPPGAAERCDPVRTSVRESEPSSSGDESGSSSGRPSSSRFAFCRILPTRLTIPAVKPTIRMIATTTAAGMATTCRQEGTSGGGVSCVDPLGDERIGRQPHLLGEPAKCVGDRLPVKDQRDESSRGFPTSPRPRRAGSPGRFPCARR